MPIATDPLQFPTKFPPKTRWKRFFSGVRWLGPDLSFFRILKDQQASRSSTQMVAWGGGVRQEMAELMSGIVSRGLGWKSTVFLPEDCFSVICHGPSFDSDDYTAVAAIAAVEQLYAITIPISFWVNKKHSSFGEIVDGILALRDA